MRRIAIAVLLAACSSPPEPTAPVVAPPVVVASPPPAPEPPPPSPTPPPPAAPVAPAPPMRPTAPFDRELHPLSPDMPDCIEMVSTCNEDGMCTSTPVYIGCGTTARVGREVLGCACP